MPRQRNVAMSMTANQPYDWHEMHEAVPLDQLPGHAEAKLIVVPR